MFIVEMPTLVNVLKKVLIEQTDFGEGWDDLNKQ